MITTKNKYISQKIVLTYYLLLNLNQSCARFVLLKNMTYTSLKN